MERESFEDEDVAEIMNRDFIAIKVDKEERPDIDSIYMSACMAVSGSGGWPLTIVMTPDQRPFFAGTYLPKNDMRGRVGLITLLKTIADKWPDRREDFVMAGNDIIKHITDSGAGKRNRRNNPRDLSAIAKNQFTKVFDDKYGGFGSAPKFPTPHNLMFLMKYYELSGDRQALLMAERTLRQMYKGGIFDHIGYGFSRYSTDERWLVPHFEKMLYDNALLCMTYAQAYRLTNDSFYQMVVTQVAEYVRRELMFEQGGFYCAQDADSDGVEGKYYVFEPREIIQVIGEEEGRAFNKRFDITERGNFEGKSIPNLLNATGDDVETPLSREVLDKLYEYRQQRTSLHKDDKILTSWNGLMIAALAIAHGSTSESGYIRTAQESIDFIEKNLIKNNRLLVSYRDGKRSGNGFLDDYAFYIWAQVEMYNTTYDMKYIRRAEELMDIAIDEFWDAKRHGFYLNPKSGEKLIMNPKETYDGAIPSGNAVMAYNLFYLSRIIPHISPNESDNRRFEGIYHNTVEFLEADADEYPTGHSFFLITDLMERYPQKEIVCVLKYGSDIEQQKLQIKETLRKQSNAIVIVLDEPSRLYPILNDRITYYVCEDHACRPGTNDL